MGPMMLLCIIVISLLLMPRPRPTQNAMIGHNVTSKNDTFSFMVSDLDPEAQTGKGGQMKTFQNDQ